MSCVLTQVTTAGRAVGTDLQPVHDVLQVSTVTAALAPHKQSFHHVVAHSTHTGTLVTPRGETPEGQSRIEVTFKAQRSSQC